MRIEKRESRSFSSYLYNNKEKRCEICRITLEENIERFNYISYNDKNYCKKCFRNLRFL